MDEKMIKAIQDLRSAKDSFDKLTPYEQRQVAEAVFGAAAIQQVINFCNIMRSATQ